MNSALFQMVITVISGVIVFVICQYLVIVLLQPIQRYKELKEKISYYLVKYANLYANPINIDDCYEAVMEDEYKEAKSKIRELAAEIRGYIEILPLLRIGIPSKEKLKNASTRLIFISNNMMYKESMGNNNRGILNSDEAKKVKIDMGIYKSKEV